MFWEFSLLLLLLVLLVLLVLPPSRASHDVIDPYNDIDKERKKKIKIFIMLLMMILWLMILWLIMFLLLRGPACGGIDQYYQI
jgi:heme/copper-type cytochrome/quinol oxidase subunit 2